MKGKNINYSMGDIDDDIILEAANVNMKKISAGRIKRRLAAVAAAAAAVLALTVTVYSADIFLTKGKSVFQKAREEGVPYESLEEYPDIKFTVVGQSDIPEDEKTAIYEKMLNTIDHFDRLKVVFGTNMTAEGDVVIECRTDISNSLAYEALYRGGSVAVEYIVDGETVIISDHAAGERRVDDRKIYTMETSPKIPLEERITINEEDGLPCYNRRGNATNCMFAPYSIFPQEIAYSFLKDHDRWEITGKEDILGRKCTVISGVPAPAKAAQFGIDAFTLFVDSETGVLMRLTGTYEGEPVKYIEVTECDYEISDILREFEG